MHLYHISFIFLLNIIRKCSFCYLECVRSYFNIGETSIGLSWQVYGNNVEIQVMCEMYNRPIHIYFYTTGVASVWKFDGHDCYCSITSTIDAEPINIFHGSYNTDTPPIRLSYHQGNHYNSLVDPRRLTIGAGLGFGCLHGVSTAVDSLCLSLSCCISPPLLCFSYYIF